MTGLSIRLPLPTPALVRDANRRFDQERYGRVDPVLRRIFSAHPKSRMFDEVLLKVALLNTLYNTRLLAVVAMADHIYALRPDGSLTAGDPALVDQIACLTVGGKQRRHYSFATKYCSWHQPRQFPILTTRWRHSYYFTSGSGRSPNSTETPYATTTPTKPSSDPFRCIST